MLETIALLAEKVVLTLAAKSITDGIGKKSSEKRVEKALEKALEKVSTDNEFWKLDVLRQKDEIISILIQKLNHPDKVKIDSLPAYLRDEKLLDTFYDCLKEDKIAFDYINHLVSDYIQREIRDTTWAIDERTKRIEERLDSEKNTFIPHAKTIRIFLGSSIDELKYERILLADYINSTVAPIFEQTRVFLRLFKCEDDPSGNIGGSSQDVTDKELEASDLSVFLFKKKGGVKTFREFKLARDLQKTRRHEIFTFFFDVPENEKSQELKDFQQRLEKEEFYWKTCDSIDSLKAQLLPALLKQIIGKEAVDNLEKSNSFETEGDACFKEYEGNKEKQTQLQERQNQLREELHQYIDNSLKEIKDTIENEDINIAVRIAKVIELYQKADQWAAATAYDKEKYSHLLYDYAQFLNKYGLYKDAEEVLLRLISIAEELYGKEDKSTAASYNEIGLVYMGQGDYGKALDYYFKTSEIIEKVLGTEHPDTATLYNNIGLVYDNKGDYDKALEYYFNALTIRERAFGTEHADTATSYNNIGLVYKDKGDYDKALEYYFKTLEIFEKILGTEYPSTATTYNNIAEVYYTQGAYDKALKYHFKALEIREKVLGTGHPDIATSYNNIGTVYVGQGDYDKALEYYFKDLAICEKVLGTEHPSTATSYNNIGGVYDEQGNYNKALEYLLKALEIREKVLGMEHPDTAGSYNNIGGAYYAQGDYDKALEYHSKALAINEKILGAAHLSTATSYNNIGLAYMSQDDYNKALEYYLKALPIVEKNLGPEHPNTVSTYNNIGWVYYKQRDYGKALEYYFKAMRIKEKVLGTEHPDTASSYFFIGAEYYYLGKYRTALKYLNNAQQIFEKILGSEHPYTKNVSGWIVGVNKAMTPDK